MASVAALIPDLLFASKISEALVPVGHQVTLFADRERLLERLSADKFDLLIVDFLSSSDIGGGLASQRLDPAELLKSVRSAGLDESAKTLACYAHIDVATRRAAQQAGFDLVVPRSRIARDPVRLVAGLLD